MFTVSENERDSEIFRRQSMNHTLKSFKNGKVISIWVSFNKI